MSEELLSEFLSALEKSENERVFVRGAGSKLSFSKHNNAIDNTFGYLIEVDGDDIKRTSTSRTSAVAYEFSYDELK